ncbi:TetR/AcrR family transcriptional regulator [Streptomyces sp. PTM05]|uniref:TetR/AcrR family transcriptional regulator n=1 Tax=Streptantibioticus parmotrematis TaxID=2873249 RepID=A0ABS7R242_9ACTN|nr:ScbR family autoregulator-binding transcription factor [Streptantibioticus parmotrematis]MBY8889021.1 TetR/AcrR family transcriptional regulator [Streptantibioticus parmotrematis]
MTQQARAVRTRRSILEAAASVFEELGYEGTSTTEILTRSGLTRGALYHHFSGKRAIADALVQLQEEALVLPDHPVRLQALVDLTMMYAERLRSDVVLRAVVRLTVERGSYQTGANYRGAMVAASTLLSQALERGELLPTVDPDELAFLLQGVFTGSQILSQAANGRADLPQRISGMWRMMLPSIVRPRLLPEIDIDPDRGGKLLGLLSP